MYPLNQLFQYPSGRWGFVGQVDVRLAWLNKDGSELSREEIERLIGCSNPAMLAKGRSFGSRDEAIAECTRLGLEYTE